MSLKLSKLIREWAFPVAGVLSSVAEIVSSQGDYTSMTWEDIMQRSLKALPFAVMGFVARSMLLKEPPSAGKT